MTMSQVNQILRLHPMVNICACLDFILWVSTLQVPYLCLGVGKCVHQLGKLAFE